jgi:hypothetical protein
MRSIFKLGQKVRYKVRSTPNKFVDGKITGIESKSIEFIEPSKKCTSHVYQVYDGFDSYAWVGESQIIGVE